MRLRRRMGRSEKERLFIEKHIQLQLLRNNTPDYNSEFVKKWNDKKLDEQLAAIIKTLRHEPIKKTVKLTEILKLAWKILERILFSCITLIAASEPMVGFWNYVSTTGKMPFPQLTLNMVIKFALCWVAIVLIPIIGLWIIIFIWPIPA